MKLADRVTALEARLHEIEQNPALSIPAPPNRRVEAARIAGKRSAEVRRSKSGSAQPKPRTIAERPEPTETPNEAPPELARKCRTILDNPTEAWRPQPTMLGVVQRVMVAWSAPFGISQVHLETYPAPGTDLRAILEALAAGYVVAELARAGDLGAKDPALLAEDSPGPSSFTLAVLERLVGPPERV
jgi:hypothetical protein